MPRNKADSTEYRRRPGFSSDNKVHRNHNQRRRMKERADQHNQEISLPVPADDITDRPKQSSCHHVLPDAVKRRVVMKGSQKQKDTQLKRYAIVGECLHNKAVGHDRHCKIHDLRIFRDEIHQPKECGKPRICRCFRCAETEYLPHILIIARQFVQQRVRLKIRADSIAET